VSFNSSCSWAHAEATLRAQPKLPFLESNVLSKSVSVLHFWHPTFEPNSSPRADKIFAWFYRRSLHR
jgi:hypothetical protein